MNNRAIIAMSGGVDSSVAALIMKENGYDCIGVTMRLFSNEDIKVSNERTCCSLDDAEDARAVARSLGIPHYVFNFSDKFKEYVIERFIYAYENGMTPNPCIDCNRYLKFDKMFLRAQELGCDRVVTGHYARIEFDEKSGRYLLKKGSDPKKDQSYVLYSMTQEQLKHTIFPLGAMTKAQIRKIAEKNGFVNAKKHDSQDICFVPDGKYADFIERYTGRTYPEGDFIDISGHVLGRHKGIIRYTVGQRKGLGLSMPEPVYVSKIDPLDNTVTLSKNSELFSNVLIAKNINLIPVKEITSPIRLTAKVRYRHPESPALVTQLDRDVIRVEFETPQRAVTRGQAVVLYDGDVVFGGGTIV
ncbi:MAG: tRNA 2-thiouridine(34) synthase MnmA [Clostridia bacterium]|nr:tRNA 2-thiouridine(34) synthase MnmA [Clostridia bacterium]